MRTLSLEVNNVFSKEIREIFCCDCGCPSIDSLQKRTQYVWDCCVAIENPLQIQENDQLSF